MSYENRPPANYLNDGTMTPPDQVPSGKAEGPSTAASCNQIAVCQGGVVQLVTVEAA
jgi:hypothetical protein